MYKFSTDWEDRAQAVNRNIGLADRVDSDSCRATQALLCPSL